MNASKYCGSVLKNDFVALVLVVALILDIYYTDVLYQFCILLWNFCHFGQQLWTVQWLGHHAFITLFLLTFVLFGAHFVRSKCNQRWRFFQTVLLQRHNHWIVENEKLIFHQSLEKNLFFLQNLRYTSSFILSR